MMTIHSSACTIFSALLFITSAQNGPKGEAFDDGAFDKAQSEFQSIIQKAGEPIDPVGDPLRSLENALKNLQNTSDERDPAQRSVSTPGMRSSSISGIKHSNEQSALVQEQLGKTVSRGNTASSLVIDPASMAQVAQKSDDNEEEEDKSGKGGDKDEDGKRKEEDDEDEE